MKTKELCDKRDKMVDLQQNKYFNIYKIWAKLSFIEHGMKVKNYCLFLLLDLENTCKYLLTNCFV